jgi:hypothetical protein
MRWARSATLGRGVALVLWVSLTATFPARADCIDIVKQMIGLFGQINNDKLKFLVGLDIDRAFRELGEGDEIECLQVMDHTVRLLKTIPNTPAPQNVTRTPP